MIASFLYIFAILLPLIIIILWLSYNIIIILLGFMARRNIYNNLGISSYTHPKISIIIPTKDEENVIGRVLESILKQVYPREKMEIIVVDGSSTNATYEIAMRYRALYPNIIKVIREENPRGKPAALNLALKYVNGDIVGVLDADSILNTDVLLNVSRKFEYPNITAIQGRLRSVNSDQNILTRIISLEEKGWYSLLMKSRDRLGLFVPITGNCFFIRKKVLDRIGGWRNELAEDIELSLRMFKHGFSVKYIDNVSSWQEAPSSIRSFISQRSRWYRGYIKSLFRYGSLIKHLNKRMLDIEALLLGPLIMAISLLGYISAIIALFHPELSAYAFLPTLIINSLTIITFFILLIVSRPLNRNKIILALSIYFYWMLEACIALKSVFDEIFRRPYKWVKTEKTGIIALETQ